MFRHLIRRVAIAASITAALVFSPLAASASAAPGLNVGVLTCQHVPGTRLNLIIHSSVRVTCVFNTPSGQERYKGTTGIGLGVDLAWSQHSQIAFAVLLAGSDVRVGSYSLAGRYVGAKGSVAVGAGVGTAALIGAGAKNVSLQPMAFEAVTGFGAAAGVGYLILEPDPEG